MKLEIERERERRGREDKVVKYIKKEATQM